MKKPKVIDCTCDFSGGTRGMDRCHLCNGTGSRFLVIIDEEAWYFPNTKEGYGKAKEKIEKGR